MHPGAGEVGAAKEEPGYLDHGGYRLYYVRHRPAGGARGKVLVAGPFALERQNAYAAMTSWARTLAGAGFEVMRFDYRGTAESTGRFREACFSDWLDDIAACYRFFEGGEGRPVALMGLRVGGLLVSRAFASMGDAMLLWEPPSDGRRALMEVLRRRLATDFMEGIETTRGDYVKDLERGIDVEVEGYTWTGRLWTDAIEFELDIPNPADDRPWMVMGLSSGPPRGVPGEHAAKYRVPRPPFWNHSHHVLPDLSELFEASLDFLEGALDERGA